MASEFARQMTLLMRWRARAIPSLAVLLGISLLQLAGSSTGVVAQFLGMLFLIALLPALICVLMVWAKVLQTGWSAFGLLAGLEYTIIAILLTPLFGLGIYVVPEMIRLDGKRLLDVELGD